MTRLILVVLLLIQLGSCQSITTRHSTAQGEGKDKTSETVEMAKQNALDNSDLIGIWAKEEGQNAIFEVTGDSIHYVEHPDTPVFYKLNDTVWTIFYDDLISENIIVKLDRDSLVFRTETGVVNRLYLST